MTIGIINGQNGNIHFDAQKAKPQEAQVTDPAGLLVLQIGQTIESVKSDEVFFCPSCSVSSSVGSSVSTSSSAVPESSATDSSFSPSASSDSSGVSSSAMVESSSAGDCDSTQAAAAASISAFFR